MRNFIEVHTLPQDQEGNIIQEGVGQKLFINVDTIAAFFVHKQYGRTTLQLLGGPGYIIRETLNELVKAVEIAQAEPVETILKEEK